MPLAPRCDTGEALAVDAPSVGKRRLPTVCFAYLAAARDDVVVESCSAQFDEERTRGGA